MRIPILPEEAGARLDKLLVQKVPGLGRAGAKRLFAEGRVRIFSPGRDNPTRAAKGDVAGPADTIEIDVDESHPGIAAVPDPDAPLTVVLETDTVIVADKPSGQPTAPLNPGEKGTLANALLARYPELADVGFSSREPGLCHRLDTGTSGLVLAARTVHAFEILTRALKEGRLDKRYLVICDARDLPQAGTIEIPLASHPKDHRRVLACIHPRDVARLEPRPAITTYETVRVCGPWALVEARAPKAARHQIRAHFAALEHPLLGDTLYGGPPFPTRSDGSTPSRHALHAHKIVWKGDTGVPAFAVTSPLPQELARVVEGDAVAGDNGR